MAQPSSVYEPRDPTATVLYGIVRDHFEIFHAHAASLRDGEGLPRFVEQKFRDFLRCGCLANDFARLSMRRMRPGSSRGLLVQGSRLLPAVRRAEDGRAAAHLVDHVCPDVPVLEWVLGLPHRLRYLLTGVLWLQIDPANARKLVAAIRGVVVPVRTTHG